MRRDDFLGGAPQQRGVVGELRVVEVAHDRAHDRPAAGRVDLVDVDEAVAPVGALGRQVVGQRGDDLARDPRRVDQYALGPARMRVVAGDRQRDLLGR
jgi:hypothetical protein